MKPIIKVIIPAFNEQDAIANVVNEIPKIVDEIIVVSNNSTDNTELNAKNAGATVLKEHRKGYGFACLKGMDYIRNQKILPEIIVFLDGDYSDYPAQLIEIIDPIIKDDIDFLIGGPILMGRGNRAHIVTPGVTVRGLLNIAALAGSPVSSYE